MTFKVADKIDLPASAVADTFAFFGTRGSGKTYGASKTVEEMVGGGAQVVVVDPVGVWYGLRLAADGRRRGLDIPVFGGLHGDIPLEPTSGELVARLVVERRTSLVLDVSSMTLGDQRRFVTAFAAALFDLKKSSRSPLLVVLEEAHEFLPQFPQANEAQMVGAVRRLSKMGRNFGIGVMLVSPRPAEVNKGAVNLTERMFCGRLKGPQDRKAMMAWAQDQEADTTAVDQLPRLANGELVHWAPAGPVRVRFFPKRTFDASKTPEADDFLPADALPEIDLEAVSTAMAATIEEAKANDPRALRARIAELERTAGTKSAPQDQHRIAELTREVDRQRSLYDNEHRRRAFLTDAIDRLASESQRIEVTLPGDPLPPPRPMNTLAAAADKALGRASRHGPPLVDLEPEPIAPRADGDRIPREARQVLTALAQTREPTPPRKVAAMAGYPPAGTSMRKALAFCRAHGWVVDGSDGSLAVNAPGMAALGVSVQALPVGDALRAWWLARLPAEGRAILTALADAYPSAVAPRELAVTAGYPPGGTSMRKGLAKLRARGLVDDVEDGVRASADLFDRHR